MVSSKKFNLAQKRSGLCLQLTMRFLAVAGHTRKTNSSMWGGALGHTVSADLETEINHVSNQSTTDGTPIKTLNTKAQGSFPGGQYPMQTAF